jgi:predicted metal-dependent phosphoesterase TrpH
MARIRWKKPDMELIRKEGFCAYDMHFHTRYSMDAISHIPDVLTKAKKLGIGVAITDHNTVQGSLKAQRKGVTIIPGIEVTGNDGAHMLYYFYTKEDLEEFYHKELKSGFQKNPFFSDRDSVSIIESAKDYECVITAPHPYGPGATGIKKLDLMPSTERLIDAIEVINGYNLHALNLKAQRWQMDTDKGMTGGTDGHTSFELGQTLTVSDGDDVDSHLKAVLNKQTAVVGSEENLIEKALLAAIKEETYISRAHHEHHSLQLLESQFRTEYNYLMHKVRMEGLDTFIHRFLHR